MNLLIVDDEVISIKGMMEGVDWKGCGVDGSIWTAYSAERALEGLSLEAISLGCADYILKPAPYEVIEEKVRKVCATLQKKQRERIHGEYFAQEAGEAQEPRRSAKSPRELVGQIEQYITKHLRESDLLVTDIAEALFLNKDYLNRVFKKEKGISVSQYLIQERMKLAGLLLCEEDSSVNAVAEQVGYNNYPYFASSFKRFYGCTPSQYQREHGR